MSWWNDPEKREAAIRKRRETAERLGPRLGHAPPGGRPKTAEPVKSRLPRTRIGPQHPTRDEGTQ